MATDIVIPKLGMTMVEAKVAEWKANEGDWIEEQQQVLVIETEKVSYEVEALGSGFLHIMAEPGTVLPVGGVAGRLAKSKEELAQIQGAQPIAAQPRESTMVAAAAPVDAATRPRRKDRIEISPVARKMAEVHGLDITGIKGTGPGGRIKKEDVEQALAAKETQATAAPLAAARVAQKPVEAVGGGVLDGKRVKATLPLTGMRGVIAEHMRRSLTVSAQLTAMGELDASELVRMRQSYVEMEAQIGTRLTYTDIMVLFIAKALRHVPIMNSSIIGNEIKLWEDIHIGVAVALPEGEYDAGLVVPVVRNADRLSLVEISKTIKDFRTKAVAGKLGLDDITGGTFTLSNIGGFGNAYTFMTPIIVQPQCAILGMGPILERPVAVGGQIVSRPLMNWSLTFDHRIVNGSPIGKFMGILEQLVKNPYLAFL